MTIEKGAWTKQVDERQVTAHEALEVMLPINEAKQLWEVNIYLISLFAALFIALFYIRLIPKKYLKWCVVLNSSFLAIFILWDITVHKQLAEELSQVFVGLE